jgi:hypothetical protein
MVLVDSGACWTACALLALAICTPAAACSPLMALAADGAGRAVRR